MGTTRVATVVVHVDDPGLGVDGLGDLVGVLRGREAGAEVEWQSCAFWETIDSTLNAAGELLRLHDDYSATFTRPTPPATADAPACARTVPAPAVPVPARAPAAAPLIVTITWPDGTTTTVHQPLTSSIARDPRPTPPPPAGGLHDD